MSDPLCKCPLPRQYAFGFLHSLGIDQDDPDAYPECKKCRYRLKKFLVHRLQYLYIKRSRRRTRFASACLYVRYRTRMPLEIRKNTISYIKN